MTNFYEYQLLPESNMTYDVPHGAKIVGITIKHGRPHISMAAERGVPMEQRTFRAVAADDTETFDSKGWIHRATSLIGGEDPGDAWVIVHVWELEIDDLDSLEIERQLLERP